MDNASNETAYYVERAVNGGAFLPLATLGANVTTFVDTTGLPATTYDYRVYALNSIGSSLYSNTATVVVPAAPAAPTNLTATLLSGPRVSVTFRDNATNETGFILQRADNGGAFVLGDLARPERSGQRYLCRFGCCPREYLRLPGSLNQCLCHVDLLEYLHDLCCCSFHTSNHGRFGSSTGW